MQAVDMLDFLFLLGSLEFGCDYSVEGLTPTQKQMLNDLAFLGLVFQRNVNFKIYNLEKIVTILSNETSHQLDVK